MNNDLKKITETALGKEVVRENEQALQTYEEYKKTLSILERVNIALGKKPKHITTSSSSLKVNVTPYATDNTAD